MRRLRWLRRTPGRYRSGLSCSLRSSWVFTPGRGAKLALRRSQATMLSRPIRPTAELPPAAVARDPLVRQPQPFGRRGGLPKDVDRHPAARVPVAADPQPLRLHLVSKPLPNADGHVLVKAAMVAERAEEQLEALALDDRLGGRIIDDEMREIGLTGHRAQ